MFPNIKAKLLQEVAKKRDKYITKDNPNDKRSDELVQATAATVGFVSEIIHHRKEKGARRQPDSKVAPTPNPQDTAQSVEESVSDPVPIIKDLAAAFLYRHSLSSVEPSQPSTNLQTPILIPQRRPNTRARGFIPAYAPILSSFDVSQSTFLDFIITLNASLEPNPYLNAINLAGFAGEASPEPIVSLMVGLGVEVVTDAIMEAQSRAKSNGFLERVNEGFFAPRGLLVFVGIWRPNESKSEQPLDFTGHDHAAAPHPNIGAVASAKSVAAGDTAAKDAWGSLKEQMQRVIVPASGEFATVNSAPLTWASDEDIAAATPTDMLKKKKDLFDRAGMWLDNHVDKHSQVKWTQEYPDHPLAKSLPKPAFRSRYADPSHAASSGDLIALLTAGQWHMREDERKKEKEVQREKEKAEKEQKKLEAKEKEKAKREQKQLESKVKKAKLKQHKLEAKQQDSDEKSASVERTIVPVNDREVRKDTNIPNSKAATDEPSSEQNKDEKQVTDLNKHNQKEKKPSSGVSSLLKDNLLYLVIVQHPSTVNRG